MIGNHELPQTQLKRCACMSVCETPRRWFFLFILGGLRIQVVERWDKGEWCPPGLIHTHFFFHYWWDYSERLLCFVCPDGSTKTVISEEQRVEKPQQSWNFVKHLPPLSPFLPFNLQVKSAID